MTSERTGGAKTITFRKFDLKKKVENIGDLAGVVLLRKFLGQHAHVCQQFSFRLERTVSELQRNSNRIICDDVGLDRRRLRSG